ncbi:MAG: type II toxin-antitoxin system Phd/YefM family antitoxin [Chloroflexota bacterium]
MINVGIRTLKERLSWYLARVRDGESLIITDRGAPVARIERVQHDNVPDELRELVSSGRVQFNKPWGPIPNRVKMLPGEKSITEYVSEQRG